MRGFLSADWIHHHRNVNHQPTRGLAGWRVAVALLALSAVNAVSAADHRFVLLQQDSWENHRGFYLDLENNGTRDPGAPAAAGKGPLTLDTLRLAMGAADGQAWHFLNAEPKWKAGHVYHVTAVIDTDHLSLSIDGHEVARGPGISFQPDSSNVEAAFIPEWANAPTTYTVLEQSLQASSNGRDQLQNTWPTHDVTAGAAQQLFAPRDAWSDPSWHPRPGQPITLNIIFSLASQESNLRTLAPFVDRFGQDRYGTWPGKMSTDAQLKNDADDEQHRLAAMPAPTDVDSYGGSRSLGWSEKGTGYYRTVRHAGKWWLLTPTGLPCFYTGMCNAPLLTDNSTPVKGREYLFAELPSQTGPYAPAWSPGPWGETGNRYFSFDTANLIRKYGDNWRDKAQAASTQRIRSFGFTGLGKWSNPGGGLPYAVVLHHYGDPKSNHGKLDVFDPAACDRFRNDLAEQIQPHRNDPLLLGWSVGNEMDEIVRTEDLAAMLAAPAATPAKIAILSHAIKTTYGGDAAKCAITWHAHGSTPQQIAAARLTAPPAEVEPLRQFYAAAYYRFIYQTVKSLDPDHLYLGFWIVPGWWVNDSDWSLIAPCCDVIGYDRYDPHFADTHLEGLFRQTAKPVLCGEFSYPPTYNGARGLGTYTQANTPDDATAGQRYQQWIHDATHNPYCVGGMWFEYRDEPLTGRGPGSGPNLIYDEHYAFGIVDVTDHLKWDLVTAMRTANLSASIGHNQANASVNP